MVLMIEGIHRYTMERQEIDGCWLKKSLFSFLAFGDDFRQDYTWALRVLEFQFE